MGQWSEVGRFSHEAGQMIFKPFKNVVAETYTDIVKCKYCGSATDVVRFGRSKGKQHYFCKACKRKFLDNKAMPGMKTPIEAIGAALGMFYEGMSLGAVSRQLWNQYHIKPSRSTLYEWIARYSKVADKLASELKLPSSKQWVVDETVLNIGGQKCWFWDVIDSESRVLLGSHLSTTRGTKDAEIVMKHAQEKTTKPPEFVISDKLAAYLDGIERAFGRDTWHIQSEGLRGKINMNLIERFHGSLKGRYKVMRGLKTKQTAKAILAGYLVHYNYFRPHLSLKGKTPAEAAGLKFPCSSWAEVVKGEGSNGP